MYESVGFKDVEYAVWGGVQSTEKNAPRRGWKVHGRPSGLLTERREQAADLRYHMF